MRTLLLIALAAFPSFAQPTNVHVVANSITNTGFAICYNYPAEDAAVSYEVEVSLLADFSVLVYDVDPVLFPNSNMDLIRTNPETGNVDIAINTTTRKRCVPIGHTGNFWPAADGSRRDRVLETLRTYYCRVDGVDCEDTATTLNIPLTLGVSQAMPNDAPFSPGVNPTLNPFYQTGYRDPFTGAYHGQIQDWGHGWAAYTGSGGITFDLAESADGCTASSGTLPDAIDTDDNIYAQCDDAGDILFVGLGDINGSKFPHSTSDFATALGFQNILLKGDCNGAGCGSGIDVEVAVTFNGHTGRTPASAWKTFQLTTTETEVRICHPEQPTPACSVAIDPGDTWEFASNGSPDTLGAGWIWTGGTCSGANNICFHEQADCDGLRVNSQMLFLIGAGGTPQFPQVTELHCGSSPPYITAQASFDASVNGNDGIPWRYSSEVNRNPGFGFMIRKKDSVANATVRIDTARWVAGVQIVHSNCGQGAGGMNTRFQSASLATPDGYIFAGCESGIYSFKKDTDGTLLSRFHGFGYIQIPGGGSLFGIPGSEVFPWSTTEPGVFYITAQSSGDTPQISPVSGQAARYVIKVALNHLDIPCGQPGTTCTLPSPGLEQIAPIDATFTNMTPCYSPCTDPEDDYTIAGQMSRIIPSSYYDNPGSTPVMGGNAGVVGESLVLMGRLQDADSFGWLYMFDLGGTGTTQGDDYVSQYRAISQRLFAYNPTWENPGGRWAGLHTFQDPKGPGGLFAVSETAAVHHVSMHVSLVGSLSACSFGGSCDVCPDVTVDTEVLNGVRKCSDLEIESAWNTGVWETQPTTFESGDPVNIGFCEYCPAGIHWLQKLRVGDEMEIGNFAVVGEVIKLVERIDNTHWKVRRSCLGDTSAQPRAWSDGELIRVQSSPVLPCTGQFANGLMWNYTADYDGSQSAHTFWTGHAFFHGNLRMDNAYIYDYDADPGDWNAVKIQDYATHFLGNASLWAGVQGVIAQPNCQDRHPSFFNFDGVTGFKNAFWDAHPLSCSQPWNRVHVTGDLYSYAPQSSEIDLILYPKHYPLYAFQAHYLYQRVSTISGAASDHGKWCYAVLVNDCFTGSTANTLYANGLVQTYSSSTCYSLEFYSGQSDFCIGNFNGFAATAATQSRAPTSNAADLSTSEEWSRIVARDLHIRGSATINIKPFTTGEFAFYATPHTRTFGVYVKATPFQDATAANFNTFIPRTITIAPEDVPMGTAKMQLSFGYDEGFRCTANTDRKCVVVSSTIDELDPFKFDGQQGSTDGISCASGCSADAPQTPGRVMRVQAGFYNSGGTLLGTTAPSFDLGASGEGGTPPTITTTCPLPAGTQGVAYSQTMTATGDATILWTKTGTLPTGLSLATNGLLEGTPSGTGMSTFTLIATNSAGSDSLVCTNGLTINSSTISQRLTKYLGKALGLGRARI